MTARSSCRLAIILLCVFASVHAADTLKYQLIDLGYQIKVQCKVLGMNNRNQVVGYAFVNTAGTGRGTLRRGFLWKNSTLELLEPLVAGRECIAEAINDSGVVVGYAYTDTGELNHRACVWRNGKIASLAQPGEVRSAAFDINNSGMIAGFMSNLSSLQVYTETAFRRTGDSIQFFTKPSDWVTPCRETYRTTGIQRNERIFDLTVYDNWTVTDEICINDSGDIAGSFTSTFNDCYGYLWRFNDTKIFLNERGNADPFHPQDMNNALQITGCFVHYSSLSGAWYHPYKWQGFLWFELLPPYQPIYARPYINNHGDLAGTDYPDDFASRALVWRGKVAYALEDYVDFDKPFPPLETAEAINDSGAIAGNSMFGGYIAIPKPPKFSMPQRGTVRVTLTQASASLVSDIHLLEPDTILLIADNLKNVGTTVDTVYEQGSELVFGIRVHRNGQTYDHLSNSKYAKTTRISDNVYTIAFEDLPDSLADWDYNDVVIQVEVLTIPSEAGAGFRVAKVQHPSVLVKGNKLAVISENIQNFRVCDLKGVTYRLVLTHVAGHSWMADLSGLARGTYVARLDAEARGVLRVVRTFVR